MKCDKNLKPLENGAQCAMQNVSSYFSFAKYVNGCYEYADNTENGDVYNNVVTGKLMTEQQIFDDWLRFNIHNFKNTRK